VSRSITVTLPKPGPFRMGEMVTVKVTASGRSPTASSLDIVLKDGRGAPKGRSPKIDIGTSLGLRDDKKEVQVAAPLEVGVFSVNPDHLVACTRGGGEPRTFGTVAAKVSFADVAVTLGTAKADKSSEIEVGVPHQVHLAIENWPAQAFTVRLECAALVGGHVDVAIPAAPASVKKVPTAHSFPVTFEKSPGAAIPMKLVKSGNDDPWDFGATKSITILAPVMSFATPKPITGGPRDWAEGVTLEIDEDYDAHVSVPTPNKSGAEMVAKIKCAGFADGNGFEVKIAPDATTGTCKIKFTKSSHERRELTIAPTTGVGGGGARHVAAGWPRALLCIIKK
jgi:hypothetical protein